MIFNILAKSGQNAKILLVKARQLNFLIGPTAVGKTALGIQWAQANNAEILCADAPLVYRGMDIGTAKPNAEEQRGAVHHGIDWVHCTEPFSVADYVARAQGVIEDVFARGKQILIVGGSGFYLKSFFEAVTDGVEISAEIAERVEELWQKEGLAGLLKELRRVGGENLDGLDKKNPRRVIKALERCLATGKSFAEVRQAFLSQPAPYADCQKRMCQLLREKSDLEYRIRLRVDIMIKDGLIDEVRALRAEGIERNPTAASVIGYRETLEYLDGKTTLSEFKEKLVEDTLQLARKQRVFFKQLPIDESILLSPGEKASPSMLFG